MNKYLTNRCKQAGMTMWGMMFVLVVIGFVATAAVKLGPFYLDNNVVKSALTDVQNSYKGADIQEISDADIKTKVGKYFEVNRASDVIEHAVKITREKQKVILSINYEVRNNFMGNVDVVLVFNNEVDLAK